MTPGRPLRYEWDGTVRRLKLPATVKLVAAYASQYADSEGRHVRPGVERLAEEAGLGTATVKRALKRLRELGLLELVRSGRSCGRQGRANEYRLRIPEDLLERVDLVGNTDRQEISDQGHSEQEHGSPEDLRSAPEQGSPDEPRSDGTGITDDVISDHQVIQHQPVTTPADTTTPEDNSLSEREVTSREALRLVVDNTRPSKGFGFCLACYREGQTTVAADPEHGDACTMHLRASREAG